MADDSEFDGLTKAAKGRHIRLKPDAAQNCAKLCSDMIIELNSAIGNASKLANTQGFGNNITNANDLAKRYNDRATTGDSSLHHALTKHREMVNDMMETFIASGRAYLENEKASAAELSKYETAIKELRPKS
ncbi:hypothetical protein [Nocardia altamirensis]|uniref:hypothetical protein n=1 Tax=Nocardia altamirensis TaxID=472158 RepID=UPI00084025E3|nr:hypothetical protein [Nocardia altamirensis]